MLELIHHGSSLFSNSVFLFAALLDCEVLFSCCTVIVTAVTLFVVTEQAGAEMTDAFDDSDAVTYESDKYGLWHRDFRLTPRLASRDGACIEPAYYPTVAQALSSTGDSGLPTLPPPSNSNSSPPTNEAPAPIKTAPTMPPTTNDVLADPVEEKLTTELELGFKKIEESQKNKEETAKKEEEKNPVIADLAKALLKANGDGDLTFEPDFRIQSRYMYDSGNGNNDFFIRRFRFKVIGSAYDLAKYAIELKIDNEGRYGVAPTTRAENAWLDFPVVDDWAYLRAGLFDLPFSRDALTSDAKLLFMDRTLIKEQLTAVGMADNTYGVMLHGQPYGGQFEYGVGVFDNDQFERFGVAGTRESDQVMPGARLVWNLLDPMKSPERYADYFESYLGKGERLELGINAAHLGNAIDGLNTLDLTAWGADVFANAGHYTFQAEYDQIIENIAGAADIVSDGWYAQVGYLFDPCDPRTEFAVRYETLDPIIGDDRLDWVRVGFNFYIREHHLKVQTDYCFRSHNTLTAPLVGGLGFFDEDVFEVQLQLDF